MKEFTTFCNSIKELVESYPQMDIEGARKVISAINEYLYTSHEQIGTIENFGITFNYFSDFHKFWHNHHEEIFCYMHRCFFLFVINVVIVDLHQVALFRHQ